MKAIDLREAMQAIKQAFTCRHCGGSILIAATGHRGRGTGRHGESVHDATGFERVTPEKHCTCPGGPLWSELVAGEIGRDFRLKEAAKLYPDVGDGFVALWWEPEYIRVTAANWRNVVREIYRVGKVT